VPRKHLNIELDQMDSCKTAHNGLQRHQRVVAHLQNRSCNSAGMPVATSRIAAIDMFVVATRSSRRKDKVPVVPA
jgi:hypothetical protein